MRKAVFSRESGGPGLSARPSRCGFGSRVLQTTVQNQLGGHLTQQWPEAGLDCEIDIPLPGSTQP